MKTSQPFTRRELLKGSGGALCFLAAATHIPSAIADAAEGGPPPVKRDPAQLKRLLDGCQGLPVLECAPEGWKVSPHPGEGNTVEERPGARHLTRVFRDMDGVGPGGNRRPVEYH